MRKVGKIMTYEEACREGTALLKKGGIEDAAWDARALLEYVCGFSRTQYLLKRNDGMPPEQYSRYRQLTKRRALRVPLQHITGMAAFCGFDFCVSPAVLIPRPDTETLVLTALEVLSRRWERLSEQAEYASKRDFSEKDTSKKDTVEKDPLEKVSGVDAALPDHLRVLDLCTGSGCIAVSLWKLAEERSIRLTMEGADLSVDALAVARENARLLGAEVHFYQSDLLENAKGSYDLIVSNPPYIPSGEIAGLSPEVSEHDPHMALDGGADGLDFYRRIAAQAKRLLSVGGVLLFEIGYDQGRSVSAILEKEGYRVMPLVQDLNGLDRVAGGMRYV